MGDTMKEIYYDRQAAVDYAKRWALGRNPDYYDFEELGGDCTNFISQCIYAGCGVMNYTPDIGWYYNSPADRAAAWTSVVHLYRFLVNNKDAGAYGEAVPLKSARIGDIVQLATGGIFHHSLMITGFRGLMPLVCAHTYDALDRPLGEYFFDEIRFLHISGARQ